MTITLNKIPHQTTKAGEHNDMPVRQYESVLIEREAAVKAFEGEYSVYTPDDVREKLEKIEPYTTIERVNGMKQMARQSARTQNETFDDLVHKVQKAEKELREAKQKLEETRAQYSRLKERLSQVKAENRRLRGGALPKNRKTGLWDLIGEV